MITSQYGTRSTFDLAYGEYKPPIFGKKFTSQAGKVILSFYRPGATELLWDNDLRPEGLTVFVSNRIGSIAIKTLGVLYILKEREDDDESELLAGQFVAGYALAGVLRIQSRQTASLPLSLDTGGFLLKKQLNVSIQKMKIKEVIATLRAVGPILGNALKTGQLFRPQCVLTEPDPDILCEYDIKIPTSEGFSVTANIYRSQAVAEKGEKLPVVMCAHPCDNHLTPVLKKTPLGGQPQQYRMLPQVN